MTTLKTNQAVTVTISNDVWSYNPNSPWTVSIATAGTLTFTLTKPGYCFVGIAFNDPNAAFASGNSTYTITNTGSASQITNSVLVLTDSDSTNGVNKFRFIVSAPGGCILVSPDPEEDNTGH